VVTVLGNSENTKEKFANTVIGLEQELQITFMNIILKYREKTDRNSILMDTGLIESLMEQLKQKDQERANIISYLKSLEDKNVEMAKELEELNNKYVTAITEKEKQLVEVCEFNKGNNMTDSIIIGMQSKSDLEEENAKIKSELSQVRKEIKEMRRIKDEEIEALKYCLEELKRKNAKHIDPLTEQLKVKVEELVNENQSMTKELEMLEIVQEQVNKLKDENKRLEDNSRELLSGFYKEENEKKYLELELKKQREQYLVLENKNKLIVEKHKFTEHQMKELQEAFETLKNEYEEKEGAHSLLSQRRETQNNEELAKLRLQVQQLQDAAQEDLKSEIVELKAKLKNTEEEKSKLEEELLQYNDKLNEAHKENQDLRIQVEMSMNDNEIVGTKMKELERVKKDKDTLLKAAKQAQDNLKELEEVKSLKEKLENENKNIMNELAIYKNNLINTKNELKQLKGTIKELHNEIIRKKERIEIMEKETPEKELKIEQVREQIEDELRKEYEEKLLKQKEALKDKLKSKSVKASVILIISIGKFICEGESIG